MRFMLFCFCLGLTFTATQAYIERGSNPNRINQFYQQSQFTTPTQQEQNRADSFQAGPSNRVSISHLRTEFGKQWRICEGLFNKVEQSCQNTNDLDEENAKACIEMYKIAYQSCYHAMNVFAYQFT